MEPTDEQVKELWEWCGLRVSGHGQLSTPRVALDGKTYFFETIDTATPDLNNLFEYAVPKINEEGYKIRAYQMANCYWFVELLNPDRIGAPPHRADKELKDALFWAIYKAMK